MQQRTICPNDANQRLTKYILRVLPKATTGFVYKMLRKKNITLNGKRAEGNETIHVGDIVTFFLSDDTFSKFAGDTANALDTFAKHATPKEHILYEDKHLIAAYKPVGLLSQKDAADSESANEQLLQYLLENGQITTESIRSFKPSICNRLDRNTAGLLLFAKTLAGQQAVARCLRERLVDKYYYALVLGEMKTAVEDRSYLTKNQLTNLVTVTDRPISDDSKAIHTYICPVAWSDGLTLVQICLYTGKSHQIRGVLQHLGHPILGDPKYTVTSEHVHEKNEYATRNSYYQRKYHLHGQQLFAYAYRFSEQIPEPLDSLRGKKLCSTIPEDFAAIMTGEPWTPNKGDIYAILEF